jgi:glycosyltransferase involved in cell wall biosynthesis
MPGISAVIIAYNEEKYIGRCLTSLRGVADEIVVVDSHSTDSTEKICAEHNVRFVKHPFEGYVEQKNFALTLASNDFILSLDADEALSDEMKKSILEIKDNPQFDGYIFNRFQNYCGKWLKHSRSYPDRQLRLFNRTRGKWEGPNPHDKFKLKPGSKIKWLKGDLLHWNFATIEEHIEKMNKFTTIAANEYFKAGKKAGSFTGTAHMLWCFFRSYILRAGFLDGYMGYLSCSITAYSSLMKYSKLRRLVLEAKKSSNISK